MSLINTSYQKKTTLITIYSVYRRLCSSYRTLWVSNILFYKFLCPLTFSLSFGLYRKGGIGAIQIFFLQDSVREVRARCGRVVSKTVFA